MGKLEFLEALRCGLSQLPDEEQERYLSYYAELIDDMVEDGMDEKTAVERLGDVSIIAEEILQNQPLTSLVRTRMRPRSGWTALSIILLLLGSPIWLPLGIALAAVVLSVYVVIWAVIVVLFAVVLSIGLSGLALLAAVFFKIGGVSMILLALGGGLFCAGLSIFAFFGALSAAKGLVRLTVLFARGIKALFIRKEVR